MAVREYNDETLVTSQSTCVTFFSTTLGTKWMRKKFLGTGLKVKWLIDIGTYEAVFQDSHKAPCVQTAYYLSHLDTELGLWCIHPVLSGDKLCIHVADGTLGSDIRPLLDSDLYTSAWQLRTYLYELKQPIAVWSLQLRSFAMLILREQAGFNNCHESSGVMLRTFGGDEDVDHVIWTGSRKRNKEKQHRSWTREVYARPFVQSPTDRHA